ncbi:ATPase involved in chromosome partitioning [Synechococcus sp. PCC 7502]|uniref:MinD/ParA family ATP-binding protein n=1 Tax=Synechococcus sp. PCC 7502 TaxID=1173263 RepID=UPI00029F9B86|nr:MinD/ParA family protein [Synechococcus sp. PCC 7502]AFY73220.1 ATPase involved in chromosome partitioning [Synechococcus sp. PCC 7502]
MPKIICVHSYRGGTGKSNLTANIATALAMEGHRVGVVDTDIQSPGVHFIFGLEEDDMDKTLNNFLWGQCNPEEVAYDVSPQQVIDLGGKIFLFPASIKPEDITRILNEGYDFKLLHFGFRQFVKRLELDYLIVDSHPGLNRETLLSFAVSNLLILILRPDRQDFQGTAVTVDIAKKLSVNKMSLVINKALDSMDLVTLRKKVEKTYDLNVLGVLTLSEDMLRLGSKGIFYLEFPEHPFSDEIHRIIKQIE